MNYYFGHDEYYFQNDELQQLLVAVNQLVDEKSSKTKYIINIFSIQKVNKQNDRTATIWSCLELLHEIWNLTLF